MEKRMTRLVVAVVATLALAALAQAQAPVGTPVPTKSLEEAEAECLTVQLSSGTLIEECGRERVQRLRQLKQEDDRKTKLPSSVPSDDASRALANASDLPSCDSAEVRKTMIEVIRPNAIYDTKNMQADQSKRWCYVYFSGPMPGLDRMRSPFQEAVFTLEWMNKSSGQWWLEIRQRQRSCRGTMESPNDNSRCG
jgi:hypothetical protein